VVSGAPAAHPDIGLIDRPLAADSVPMRTRRVHVKRCELLDPVVHAAFREKLSNISIGQAKSKVSEHRESDDLDGEAIAAER
jgi:hypothetical protein